MASQIEALPQVPQQILPIPVLTENTNEIGNVVIGYMNDFEGYGEGITVRMKDGAAPEASDMLISSEGTPIQKSGKYYIRAVPSSSDNTIKPSPSIIWDIRTIPKYWTRAAIGNLNEPIVQIVFDGVRFIARASMGLYASEDGIAWQKVQDGISGNSFSYIAANAGKYFAIAGYHVFISADGYTWTQKSSPDGKIGEACFISDEGIIYVGCRKGYIFSSADNGDTWSELHYYGADITQICPFNGNIYFNAGSQLYAYDGIDWPTTPVRVVSALYRLSSDANYLYIISLQGNNIICLDAEGNDVQLDFTSPEDIVTDGGKIIVAEYNNIMYSTELTAPFNFQAANPNIVTISAIASGHGLFVAAASNYIYYCSI